MGGALGRCGKFISPQFDLFSIISNQVQSGERLEDPGWRMKRKFEFVTLDGMAREFGITLLVQQAIRRR